MATNAVGPAIKRIYRRTPMHGIDLTEHVIEITKP